MSSRRTRRGTPLDAESSRRKLRQTQSRKQNSPPSPIAGVQISDDTLDNDSINVQRDPRYDDEHHHDGCEDTGKLPATTSMDTQERVLQARATCDGLNRDAGSADNSEGSYQDTIATVNQTDPAHMKVANRDVTSLARCGLVEEETPKKSRKSEILVSLLENETYPCVKLKTKFDLHHADSDHETGKSSSGAFFHKSKDGDMLQTSLQPTCLFPYCEHRGKQSYKTDFISIPEVPEEPFLVSLSKDKNKELNMVTTTSGTLRVGPGSAMRRFLSPTQVFLGSGSKSSCPGLKCGYGIDSEGEKESQDKNKASSLVPEILKASLSSEFSMRNTSGQPFVEWKNSPTKKENVIDTDLSSKVFFETDNGPLNDPKAPQIITEVPCRKEQSNTDVKIFGNVFDDEKVDSNRISCQRSTITNNSIETPQKHDSGYIDDNTTPKGSRLSTSCTGNPHCLIENMLDESNSQASLSSSSSAAYTHAGTKSCSEDGKKHYKKSHSLLRMTNGPLATSSPSTSLNLTGSSPESAGKGTIKRSERIRCKSKPTPKDTHDKLQLSLPSKLSQNGKKSKKFKSCDALNSKLKSSIKKKTIKKMKKSISNKSKSKEISEKSTAKALSKSKNLMTRKVMDGIVQSIEETVQRASQDESLKEEPESVAGGYSNKFSSAESKQVSTISPPAEIGGFESISGTVLPHAEEENSSFQENLFFSPLKPASPIGPSHNLDKKRCRKGLSKNKNKKVKGNKLSCISDKQRKKIPKLKGIKGKLYSDSNTVSSETDSANNSVGSSFKSEIDAHFSVDQGTNISKNNMSMTGKRSRKKTKKAKEAFEDIAVFWEDEHPPKKSKSKKRSVEEGDASGNSSTKRARRNSQMGELMADPVLEEHAFILWASENRREIESQNPAASACEVDAILSSRWCDVLASVKSRFFLRAREAFSDGDRHTLQAGPVAVTELDTVTCANPLLDRDPLFIEFMRLPVDRQRDMLRKWLKFFQRMLPKKEYIDFIVTFKTACGESDAINASPGKQMKRPRMRCLDPAHYRMLFDMIRLTRPRVVEVCREKGKEKKMVSQTYSMILHKLVCGETWPQPNTSSSCRSQSLTEILLDLNIEEVNTDPGCVITSPAAIGKEPELPNNTGNSCVEESCQFTPEKETTWMSEVPLMMASSGRCSWRNAQECSKPRAFEDFPCDLRLDDSDYAFLDSDLACSLLSGLSQMSELPVIDQNTLDQMFLAPPRKEVRSVQTRRGVGGGAGSLGGPLCGGRTLPSVTLSHLPTSSPCQRGSFRRLLPVEPSPYPKMNIYHPPSLPVLGPPNVQIAHHHQQMYSPASPATTMSPAAALAGGHCLQHNMLRGEPVPTSFSSTSSPSPLPSSSLPLASYRTDSLMDMHSYSITMGNNCNINEAISAGATTGDSNTCPGRLGPGGIPNKYLKVHPKTVLGPTTKLNVQALHLPLPAHNNTSVCTSSSSRCSGSLTSPGTASPLIKQQHPRIVPALLEHQQQQSMMGASTMSALTSKSRNHHILAGKFNSQVYPLRTSTGTPGLSSSCSRMYPQHGGLGSSSPLITSLSPLRNVKYQGQLGGKLYSPSPCTMMPYRPRLQLSDTAGIGASPHCHRRATHAIPISTTLNTFGSARGQGGNLQQIKVCLPTQALKIPIAKLRGAKKSTYVKGKLKNVGLPPTGQDCVGSLSFMSQQNNKTPTSVLAKVLSFQMKGESEYGVGEFRSPVITEVSYASTKLSPSATTFIGTMRPLGSHLDCGSGGTKSSKAVQLMSVDSRTSQSRPLGSTHTAVIVSPMSIHKRGSTSMQQQVTSYVNNGNDSKTYPAIAATTIVMTTTSGCTAQHTPKSHLASNLSISCHLQKSDIAESHHEHSMGTCSSSAESEDDTSVGSQFVVVGTRTTCLPIPKRRVHWESGEGTPTSHKCHMCAIASSSVDAAQGNGVVTPQAKPFCPKGRLGHFHTAAPNELRTGSADIAADQKELDNVATDQTKLCNNVQERCTMSQPDEVNTSTIAKAPTCIQATPERPRSDAIFFQKSSQSLVGDSQSDMHHLEISDASYKMETPVSGYKEETKRTDIKTKHLESRSCSFPDYDHEINENGTKNEQEYSKKEDISTMNPSSYPPTQKDNYSNIFLAPPEDLVPSRSSNNANAKKDSTLETKSFECEGQLRNKLVRKECEDERLFYNENCSHELSISQPSYVENLSEEPEKPHCAEHSGTEAIRRGDCLSKSPSSVSPAVDIHKQETPSKDLMSISSKCEEGNDCVVAELTKSIDS